MRKNILSASAMIKNKRGLSDVITVVLIILLAIVAVGMIWLVISRTLKSTEGSIDASQFTVKMEIVDNYVVVDNTNKKVLVNIRRGPGEGEVSGARIVLEGDTGTTFVYEVNQKIEQFTTIKAVIDYTSADFTSVKKIYLYPIILSPDGKEVAANVVDEYNVRVEDEEEIPGICGEGVKNGDDACDGTDFGLPGDSDQCNVYNSNDYSGGTLQCNENCQIEFDSCIKRDYYIFVTSTTTTGNLGGLTGADTICEQIASAGHQRLRDKEWKAWISDRTVSAADRLSHGANNYKMIVDNDNPSQDILIANDWNDLVTDNDDGNYLRSKIDRTEAGNQITGVNERVYTHTDEFGQKVIGNTACNDWTDGTTLQRAQAGSPLVTTNQWTNMESKRCDSLLRLICFEQPQ